MNSKKKNTSLPTYVYIYSLVWSKNSWEKSCFFEIVRQERYDLQVFYYHSAVDKSPISTQVRSPLGVESRGKHSSYSIQYHLPPFA